MADLGEHVRRNLLRVLLVAALGIFSGCGPSIYVFNSIPAAQVVEQAQQAGAREHAPYEYFIASAYLRKAEEEAAEANYQDAIHFAEQAYEFGTRARDMSRRHMREMGR